MKKADYIMNDSKNWFLNFLNNFFVFFVIVLILTNGSTTIIFKNWIFIGITYCFFNLMAFIIEIVWNSNEIRKNYKTKKKKSINLKEKTHKAIKESFFFASWFTIALNFKYIQYSKSFWILFSILIIINYIFSNK